jgi:hypothetical protein
MRAQWRRGWCRTTFHGRFVELVPNERVVEVVEFETADPALRGEMTLTIELTDADGGTDLVAVHDHLPPGLSPADNDLGWQLSLSKLAALVEGGRDRARDMTCHAVHSDPPRDESVRPPSFERRNALNSAKPRLASENETG